MVTALVGAGIILGLGVASAEEVFYSHETGVDWESRQLLDLFWDWMHWLLPSRRC